MAMILVKGRSIIRFFPKATSTTFTRGDLVQMVGNVLTTATAGVTSATILGSTITGVASTDGNYATAAALLGVEMPVDSNSLYQCAVNNGSLLTTSIGTKFAVSTAGAVDVATNGATQPLLCVQFISASLGLFQIANSNQWAN